MQMSHGMHLLTEKPLRVTLREISSERSVTTIIVDIVLEA